MARGLLRVVCLLAAGVGLGQAAFTCAPTNDAGLCAALGAFYSDTVGSNWTNNAGWSYAQAGNATSYCSLFGITCNASSVPSTLCVRHGSALAESDLLCQEHEEQLALRHFISSLCRTVHSHNHVRSPTPPHRHIASLLTRTQ
jgi:hypothetical protein